MSTLTFIGSGQARRRKTPYDIAVENGFQGNETEYEAYIHGITVAQVTLYKRASSAPNSYAVDGGSNVTYTFSNGKIDFSSPDPSDDTVEANTGWHSIPYSGTGDLYVIYASANSKNQSDLILPTEWSTPVIMSEEAVQGDPGNNVCIVFIYNASTTTPTLPSSTTNFTFSTGSITGLDNSWVKDPPVGDKIWVSTAIAMSQGASANIASTSWSTPKIWKEKGDKGDAGATIASVEYGVSQNSSTQPSSWSTTITPVNKGDWLWVKTTYTDNTVSYSKSYIGTDGADGNSVYVQSATKVDKTTTVVIVDDEGHTNTLTIVDGDDGETGEAGLNGYVHIAWANSADGSVDFSTSVSAGKSYIGSYTDNTAQDSQTYYDYSWAKIKGEDGSDGADGADGATISSVSYGVTQDGTMPSEWSSSVPSTNKGDWLWVKTLYTDMTVGYTKSYIGTDGEDGNNIYVQSATKSGKTTTVVITDDDGNTNTLTIVDGDDGQDGQDGQDGLNGYVHIAWANSSDGSVDFSTSVSTGKSYIGTYTDNIQADSQYYTDYSWSLIKGADGADGKNGKDGVDGATIYSVEYGVSSAGGTQPESWSSTVTTPSEGQWMWVKTTYTDGTESYTKSYIGTDGEDGNNIYVTSATKSGKTTTVVITDDDGNTNTLTIVDGDDGQDGQNGINGLNGYVHIAWANSADGRVDFSTSVSEGKSYIGTYSDNTSADSQDYEDYSWSLIKGADGADGTDGSVWYTGTVLTGSTTATGVAGALRDKYLNTSTSNVYECTTAGDSSTAIWTYVANIKGQSGTDGATWISGTILSGQTTATGVAGALGDMYINTSTDNVYECTTAGDSSTAIWTYRMNIKGSAGTPANVLDFNATGLTYVSNLRVNSYTEIKVTADLQGSYTSGTLYTEKYNGSSWVSANIIYYDTTSHDPMISQSSVSNNSEVTLRIPMTESAQFRIRLVSSGDTIIKEISPIDETEYDHDWGSIDELPVSYLDRSDNTCTPLNGDYFVARIDFEMSPVTPQAGDNPQENGWYVRTGTSEPYTYEKTTDTTVVSGKTYYDYAHKKGVPYTLSNNSWIELTVSNPSDAEKTLNLLGSVLNDPSIQPSMKTLYMWVKNLMALEATIESLFSRTITLLNNGVFKSATLTYDSDDNRFVKEGFILDSTGDVKLGKAFLRDIKLKCSDSQSKILLETQEHQDGMSAFNPIDTSVSARWCTSDITGLLYSSPTQVTFNSVSRYMIRPTESDTGYKHKIITGRRTGGSAGMGVKFVAPYTGRYYIVMGNSGGVYCQCKNITTGKTYFTQAFVGYFSCTAGDTIEAVNASTFDAYFCKYENYVYMVASKTTSTYTESNITRTIEYYQEVDALELGVYPTDTLVIGTSFDSSSHLDYKVLSSSFSQLSDGEIKCENNSYLTVDGTTYSNLTTIQKTSSILTFNNGSTSVSLSYPRDTSNRAKTGWSKCSGGSIDPVGQDSALITYNIYPSEQNTCYIGNQDNKFASAYINTINSTTVNGTHVGNVNSSGTSYSVYGAVFN